MKVAFNTGAHYTEFGQRITVQLIKEEQCAVFVDHDRGLWQSVPIPNPHCLDTPSEMAHWVMQAYLHNQCSYAAYGSMADEVIKSMRALGYDDWIVTYDATVLDYRLIRY